MVFVAGQLPIVPGQMPDSSMSVDRHVEATPANIDAIPKPGGNDLAQVGSMTVSITNLADWQIVNATYVRIFGEHRPARTTVPVAGLHDGLRVEIQANCRERPLTWRTDVKRVSERHVLVYTEGASSCD